MNATSKFLKQLEDECVLSKPTLTTARWCAYCKSKRHFTRGCPNLRRRTQRCWSCGEPAHNMNQCTQREIECTHSGPHLVVARGTDINRNKEIVRNLEEEFQKLKPLEALMTYEQYGEAAIIDLVDLEEMEEVNRMNDILEEENIEDGLLQTQDDNLVLMWLDLYEEVEWMEENRRRSGITFWNNLIARFKKRYEKFEGAAKLDQSEWNIIIMRMRTSISNNHCYLRHDTVVPENN